ncbi:6-phosphogluconate dehydrogenase domain protein [Ketogulonicigenium vulgare WSH-001]|uniref:6-phosphogluconate dehydrogenase domain protein n=2 Tax=Ketogulonicigenium vulgare TaxID=92945 RepID=F9Y550_KETVW|nr:6-phosphogluconate dehydrogenase domain protein [Ketogulonicigenium vulgare WSH-001]
MSPVAMRKSQRKIKIIGETCRLFVGTRLAGPRAIAIVFYKSRREGQEMAKVAFLGLGVMGGPMAGHLVAAGHQVTVYNRTTAKAEAWVAAHGHAFGETPEKAVAGAEFVMTCVGNDDDLRAICAAAFPAMARGATFVDHTTVSAKISREMAALAESMGLNYIDAPVSGGQAGAVNGVLSIMCGGRPEVFEAAAPIMAAYGRICKLLGPAGAGQLAKMCNQIAIAGVVQGLAESLHFAKSAGLDGAALVEVISQGAAGSWQMGNRAATMLAGEYDFGFAVDWMRKDLGIVLDAAEETGASLPLTALVDQFYKDVQKLGGGRWDTSSLLARLEKF